MIDLDCNDDIVDRWIQVKKTSFQLSKIKHSARNDVIDVVDVDDDVDDLPEEPAATTQNRLVSLHLTN